MEVIFQKRKSARGWLTRATKDLDDICQDPNKTKSDLQIYLEALNKKYDAVESLQLEYECFIGKDEDLAKDQEKAEEWFAKAKLVRRQAIHFLDKFVKEEADEKSSEGRSTSSQSRSVKLPKLELPTFSGDVTKWKEFWDQFKANIDDTDIPVVTKFTYLKSLLEGEAQSTIQGLTLTADHYKTACQILEQRFGRKELIVFSHIQSLLSLRANEGLKDNLAKLKNILDQVNVHIRSLETMGIDGPTYGVMLTPVILSRLPADVRMEWAREGENREGDLEFLLQFLKQEIERRERANTFRVEAPKPQARVEEKKSNSKSTRKNSGNKNQKPSTAAALQTSSEKGKECVFCKRSNHPSSKC